MIAAKVCWLVLFSPRSESRHPRLERNTDLLSLRPVYYSVHCPNGPSHSSLWRLAFTVCPWRCSSTSLRSYVLTACQIKQTANDSIRHPIVSDQRWRAAIANYMPLGALLRTSRLLRALVTPILYHRIVSESWLRDELFPVVKFFCQYPDLALHTREVSILEIKGEGMRSSFSIADFSFLEDASARMGSRMPELVVLALLKMRRSSAYLRDTPREISRELRSLLVDLGRVSSCGL